MGVVLELKEGPMAGKVIGLKTGESVTIGRAAGRAQFALPHDTFMSGVHFAVECGTSGCRVQDRKSSNGTFLNGARISEAMLANGDEIKGGQTIFKVKIVADAKLASMLPAQDVAPPTAPPPRSREPEPAAPPAASQQQRPRVAEPAAPPAVSQQPQQPQQPQQSQQPRQRGPEPARPQELPSFPEPRPRAAEPVVPPAASQPPAPNFRPRVAEPVQPSAQAAPPRPAETPGVEEPAIQILSELRPAAMPSVSLDDVVDSRRTRDAGVEPPPQNFEAAGDTPGRERSTPQPPVEAPPSPRAIPSTPGGGANARRPSQPPPGVASHIARKFGDGPLERGDGSRPLGPAFSVMGWSFPSTPAEWQVQEGFGLQQSGHEEFPGSVAATEELLGGITLQQFVESQISTLRGYLRDARIEPTMPPRVGGADESMAMDVRHSTKDGRELVYRRIYARSGSSVGVLTVTTLASEFPQVLQSLQSLLDGAAFRATANVQ